MVITFILALIGIFGTLTIIAYLRQVEDGISELHNHLDAPVCPTCQVPHSIRKGKKVQRSWRSIKKYYSSKRKAKVPAREIEKVLQ